MIGTFLSAPTRPISEFSLSLFGEWYQDLPLAEVMTHNESEHCEEQWQYNVILLYPKILRKSKKEGRKFDWAISLANAFYVEEFNGTFKDMLCINMSLLFDPTIVIVGHPLRANEVPGFSKSISRTKDVVVISAITLRNGTGNECGSSYVVWLLVAPSKASKPLQITSWRRQGFGRFILIMLIKRSSIELLHFLEQPVCQEPIKGLTFTCSTPRLMPRHSTNPVDLFESMTLEVLVLSCFQNRFLHLKFRKIMVVLHGFHLIQMNMPRFLL
jgi:hypothetical protein